MRLEPPDLISDEELERLILAFAESRSPDGITESETAALLEWARQARVDGVLLSLVLDTPRQIDVDVRDGEPVFRARAPRGD